MAAAARVDGAAARAAAAQAGEQQQQLELTVYVPRMCAPPALITIRSPSPNPPGAAAQRRGNDFNFYPSASHPGCGNGDCAFPGAWSRANQTQYKALGGGAGGVLKIAISDYFPKQPTLYVVPGAWCDSDGALADGDSNGIKPRYNRRRRFLLQGGSPPAVTVNSGAACFLVGEDAVGFKIGGGQPVAAERVNNGAYKIPLPANMPDVSGGGAVWGVWRV
jgi:hypothetical protein